MFQSTESTESTFIQSINKSIDKPYRMPFGKYKGLTLDELNPEYINFLLIQEWFNSKDILQEHVRLNDIQLILKFGKYKGSTINEIAKDEDYIKFLREKNIVHEVFLK